MDPLRSSEFRTVAPNTAAGQTVVLLSDGLGKLKLSEQTQKSSDAVLLKLGPPRVSDQDLGAVGFDAAVQPAVEACGEGLVVEHVTQQDQVEGLDRRTNHIVGETHGRLKTVQLRVHAGGDSCNCNSNRHIYFTLYCTTVCGKRYDKHYNTHDIVTQQSQVPKLTHHSVTLLTTDTL